MKKDTVTENVIGAFIIVVLAILLFPVVSIWTAWWIAPLWEWFAVPIGLPTLTFYQVAGLKLLHDAFFKSTKKYEDHEIDSKHSAIMFVIAGPMFYVLGLWLKYWIV